MNKQSLLFSLLFILVASLSSFAERSYSIEPFDEIHAAGRVNIVLEPGEVEEVSIRHQEEHVSVEVRSGVLYIKRKDRWKPKNYKDGIEVIVRYQKLRRISGDAGAEVSSAYPLVTSDALRLAFGSGAQAELEVNLEDLEVNVGEGSQVELEGFTQEMTAKASTGGMLQAYDLQSKRTYVRANTGGQAEVVALEYLEANANTGGIVSYKGDPEKTNISNELGGRINGRGL